MSFACRFRVLHPILLARNPGNFFHGMSDLHGDPFVLRFPGLAKTYVTGNPDYTQQIFTAPVDLLEPAYPNPITPLLGSNSLIAMGGTEHLQMRKQLSSPLHGECMHFYADSIQAITLEAVRNWGSSAVCLQTSLQWITLRIIIRVVFGIHDRGRFEQFYQTIVRYLQSYKAYLMLFPYLRIPFGSISPWSRFLTAYNAFDRLLDEEIHLRQKNLHPSDYNKDILSSLLGAGVDSELTCDRSSLKDQLRTLLVAGHETTAISLTWAIYFVLQDKNTQKTLEVSLQDLGSSPEPNACTKLQYLHMICQEATRLNPVVPIVMRRAKREMLFGDIAVNEGENIAVSTMLLHSHARSWHNPEQFIPERFKNTTYTPYEYAPFGGGVRRCLGAAFAMNEMKIILGTLFSLGQFSLHDNESIMPMIKNVTMGPAKRITVNYRKYSE